MSTTLFERLLSDFRHRHCVPALGAALVSRDGRVDLSVTGVTTRNGDEPVSQHDQWHLGSCGKSITAALYARLVERGDARWGAAMPSLFPDLASTMHPAWADVSVDDVYVHRAGLAANLDLAAMRAGLRDTRPLREQRLEAVARALAGPPKRRGRFHYSNLGYVLAGAAIEIITDLPFEDALMRHVLEPLEITSGGFGPPPRLRGHGGRARAPVRLGLVLGRGPAAEPDDPESDNPPIMSPAGRLHITLNDWAKFQRIFLADGAGFLRLRGDVGSAAGGVMPGG